MDIEFMVHKYYLLHYMLAQLAGYDNSLMCLAGGDEFSLQLDKAAFFCI